MTIEPNDLCRMMATNIRVANSLLCVTLPSTLMNKGRKKLTNRRSRGPCNTDALMDEALDRTGRCIGACSHAAEGAILGEKTAKTWDGSGMKRCDCIAWLDEAQEIDRCVV